MNHELQIPGYVIVQLLGSGSGGNVYEAIDIETQEIVALKIMQIPMVQCGIPETVWGEIGWISGIISSHLVRIQSVFMFPQSEKGSRLAGSKRGRIEMPTTSLNDSFVLGFSMNRMWCTLREFMHIMQKRTGADRVIPADVLQYIMHGILAGLAAMNYNRLIHQDIKPDNVLFTPEGNVVISDFGLVRISNVVDSDDPIKCCKHNTRICTRHYRPIEAWMMADFIPWNTDIFSVGVILLELVELREVLLDTQADDGNLAMYGTAFRNFLRLLFDILGVPQLDLWQNDGNHYNARWLKVLEETIAEYNTPNPHQNSVPIDPLLRLYKWYGAPCFDFAMKLLAYDPHSRLTSQSALYHPWIQSAAPRAEGQMAPREKLLNILRSGRDSSKRKKKESHTDTEHIPYRTDSMTSTILPPEYRGKYQVCIETCTSSIFPDN